MANLVLSPQWGTGVYQLETNDPVLGGPEGISNRQARELGDRTEWLKAALTALDGSFAAALAAHAASRSHPAATTSALGLVELATIAEALAGADTTRAVTPAGLAAMMGTSLNAMSLQILSAPGSHTWVNPGVPGWVLKILTGSGGGGGGTTGGGASTAGAGGGGGATEIGLFRLEDLPSTVPVQIGAGGPGRGSASSKGDDGAPSSFGALLLAPGGVGGGRGEGTYNTGGSGGSNSASTAALTVPGGPGLPAAAGVPGAGGGSFWGGGGRPSFNAGGHGLAPGAGGAGAKAQGGADYVGGNGAAGCLFSLVFRA